MDWIWPLLKWFTNTPAAATHNFFIERMQYVSISLGWMILNNALLLKACTTVNYYGAAGMPIASSHTQYTYTISVTVIFTFTGTGLKIVLLLLYPL